MLFRFFCDFHFFCFQLCSVCFCVVLQFRGLSFSLYTHNFFRLLCVCVCVCAVSDHVIVKSFVASSASCSSNGFILI